MTPPRVSFVVPCYNYGRFVGAAMDSLLGQHFADLEVIVIDDASTDDSAEVLKRYADDKRVTIVRHEENQRHIRSFNDGLALARGEFVALFSADDLCLSRDAAGRIVDVFDHHPNVGMVYAAYGVVERGEVTTNVVPFPEDRVSTGLDEFQRLMRGNYILHSGTFLRREVQEALGPYEATLPQCSDWDMWLRATAAQHDVGYIAEPIYGYRLHESNMQKEAFSPAEQADQNVRALERGFAALAPGVSADILRERPRAVRHALLQTVYFDLFNGRRARSWRGVAYAVRRRPATVASREFLGVVSRLLRMTLGGRERYRRSLDAPWLQNPGRPT